MTIPAYDPYDEFGHRPGCHRPSPTPTGTAIVLLGDQTPVPAENRVRRDDAYHLTQEPPAECLAAHREATALGVGQAKRSRTKMLPEDAILLPEIVDAIFLVSIHPPSHGQHEEVQSVGHGRRLHGSDTAVTHVVSGIHSPRPFSRTIRGQHGWCDTEALGFLPQAVGLRERAERRAFPEATGGAATRTDLVSPIRQPRPLCCTIRGRSTRFSPT